MKYKTCYLITILGSVLFLNSCGNKKEENKTQSSSEIKTESKALATFDPAQTGTLYGKVLFKGTPPVLDHLPIEGNPECKAFHSNRVPSEEVLVKDGLLQNVFIYIKEGLENYSFESPKEPVKIDQSKCIYIPHVTGAQINQPILLVNSDPTLHNVHSYAKNNDTWNLGMPFEGMEITKTFSKPEVMISLKCDVHPWMTGYLGVLPHPYFVVTGADGSFEIKNIPPGEYLIEAWHEKLGTQSQKIKVNPQEAKELEFSFELSQEK